MEAGTRVFSDATQSSPSGCKKLGKHGSRKGAVRQWALQNDEKNQQGGHSIYQRRYAWNEKNLLKESSDGRHTVYYRYGADGQRALKSSGQSETLYFNTMWSWIHNSSAYNTDREIKHIYLGSERLVTRTNGAGSDGHTSTADACTYYYHSDHLGSAHLITDYKGDEYERVEYTPYGEYRIEKSHAAGIMKSLFFTSFAEQNSVSNRKVASFTGKERDEARTIAGVLCVGLYYYGARYLDPKTSRWLSTDPALGEYMAGSNAGVGGIYNQVNFNLYHYAGNNPIKYTDPTGMWVDNEDGTYTAEKDDTLWGLAQEIFGDGSRWEEFGYEGDPTKLQVGDTVGRNQAQRNNNISFAPVYDNYGTFLGYGAEAEERKVALQNAPSLNVSLSFGGSVVLLQGNLGFEASQNYSGNINLKPEANADIGIFMPGIGATASLGISFHGNVGIENHKLSLNLLGFGGAIAFSEKGLTTFNLSISTNVGNKGNNSDMGIGYNLFKR